MSLTDRPKISLHHSNFYCPITSVSFRIDRCDTDRNHVVFDLFNRTLTEMREYGSWSQNSIDEKESLVTTFMAQSNLEDLGATLIRRKLHRLDYWHFTKELVDSGYQKPEKILVKDYRNARNVIDYLFRHNAMSAANRADMEDSLKQLERSGDYSTRRFPSISIAQKDCIISMVSPYIDDIKAEAPDVETAKKWIKESSKQGLYSSDLVDNPGHARFYSLRLITRPVLDEGNYASYSDACNAALAADTKSNDFYESLFTVARIFASKGDLEGALDQLGPTLPSEELIQQTILDLFDPLTDSAQ